MSIKTATPCPNHVHHSQWECTSCLILGFFLQLNYLWSLNLLKLACMHLLKCFLKFFIFYLLNCYWTGMTQQQTEYGFLSLLRTSHLCTSLSSVSRLWAAPCLLPWNLCPVSACPLSNCLMSVFTGPAGQWENWSYSTLYLLWPFSARMGEFHIWGEIYWTYCINNTHIFTQTFVCTIQGLAKKCQGHISLPNKNTIISN